MEFKNKKTLIAGIQGSGKTFLSKSIVKGFKTFVLTPHTEEWKSEKVILYKGRFLEDFDLICNKVKSLAQMSKIELFVIDELDMIFRNHLDLHYTFTDLITNHRHYNLGVIGITRRIEDIPTRYYGTFENMIVFKIESPQMRDLLDRYAEGFGDLVFNLDFNSHQFAVKELGQAPKVMTI